MKNIFMPKHIATYITTHLKFTIQTTLIEVSKDVVVSWTNNLPFWKLVMNANTLDIFLALESTDWLLIFTCKKLTCGLWEVGSCRWPYPHLPHPPHTPTHKPNAKAFKQRLDWFYVVIVLHVVLKVICGPALAFV